MSEEIPIVLAVTNIGDMVDLAALEKSSVLTVTNIMTGDSVMISIDPEESENILRLAAQGRDFEQVVNQGVEEEGIPQQPVAQAAHDNVSPFPVYDASDEEMADSADPTSDGI